MAKSKYEYVKAFEQDDSLLPECWIVVRIDGRGFHKFSDAHRYTKPNDKRGLDLMNRWGRWRGQLLHDPSALRLH